MALIRLGVNSLGMQIPLSHLKSFSEHSRCEQLSSSLPSRHSAFPSQTQRFGRHPLPSAHLNLSGPQRGLRSHDSSSVPSALSCRSVSTLKRKKKKKKRSSSSGSQTLGLKDSPKQSRSPSHFQASIRLRFVVLRSSVLRDVARGREGESNSPSG